MGFLNQLITRGHHIVGLTKAHVPFSIPCKNVKHCKASCSFMFSLYLRANTPCRPCRPFSKSTIFAPRSQPRHRRAASFKLFVFRMAALLFHLGYQLSLPIGILTKDHHCRMCVIATSYHLTTSWRMTKSTNIHQLASIRSSNWPSRGQVLIQRWAKDVAFTSSTVYIWIHLNMFFKHKLSSSTSVYHP